MTFRTCLMLCIVLSVAACGGGGGGGPGNGDGNGNGNGDGGGDGNGDGNGDGGTSPNGSAEITFPLSNAGATGDTLTLRGRARDPEGVLAVTVNGVAATIDGSGDASSAAFQAKAGLAEDEVEWTAEVELSEGENDFSVSVEDEDGEVSEDVDETTVTLAEVPTFFSLDTDNTRLVGLSFTLTEDGYEQRLVEHDYATLEQRSFDLFGNPLTTCFRPFENEFLHLEPTDQDSWALRRFDLTAGQDSLLFAVPDAAWDAGPDFAHPPRVARLVCGGTSTSAFALVNYTDENGAGHSGSVYAKSRVVELDLATQEVNTLSETDTSANPRWIVEDIALAEEVIVAMRELNPVAPLTAISLADGSRMELASTVDVGGLALDPVLDFERVYVATFQGVDEIDLAAPASENISPVDTSHPYTFEQARSVGFDPANNRVIVGDEGLDMLIAIDVDTGERTELLSRRIGSGVPLIAPRSFAIDAAGETAYVADDGGNASSRLFAIDLATGDRTLVGDINAAISGFATGLALDEAGGRVFVSSQTAIVAVDLETGQLGTIADVDSSELESIRGLALDAGNGRLLVGDPANDAVFTVDAETHAVEVFSQEGVRGAGPAFGAAISLALDAVGGTLYVAGQLSETVTSVDLASGDREALATSCDLGLSSTFQTLDEVYYSEVGNELLIRGDGLYSVDLGTEECDALPLKVGPFQLATTPSNELLAVAFRVLMQLDRETGAVVVLSR